MAKLTKGVLQGAKFQKTISVDVAGEKYELDVRPLSGTEAQRVDSASQAGADMKGRAGQSGRFEQSLTIDMAKNSKGRKDSEILACALGTVDQDFTEDTIRESWPNPLIVQVAKEVKTLSGLDNESEEETEQFPEGEQPELEQSGESGDEE